MSKTSKDTRGAVAPIRPVPPRMARPYRALLLGSVASVLGHVAAVQAASPAPTELPTGGSVAAGQATITQSGATLNVNQSTSQAIINWQSFNIGAQAQVDFQQPSASSLALNRVAAGNASTILGKLTSNGQVILINPAGIVFGGGAQVDTGGLIASVMDLRDADFLAGKLNFQRGTATGLIENDGTIKVAPGGVAAFLAPQIANNGLISAKLGTVVLASGDAVTLAFDATGKVSLTVDPATVQAQIDNGGMILARDGSALLTAKAVNVLLGGAINDGGKISASSLKAEGGRIVLDGTGPINLAGAKLEATGATGGGTIVVGDSTTASVRVDSASVLDASARKAGNGGAIKVDSANTIFAGTAKARGGKRGGNGGSVETSGAVLAIGGARVDTGARHGTAGSWLLDPWDLTIDASAATAINTALGSGSVTLQTTNTSATTTYGGTTNSATGVGDINIASAISWSTDNSLTLDAYHSVNVNANITASGNNAGLVVKYNDGGSGGNLLTGAGASVTLAGTAPTLTINTIGYTLITTNAVLQGVVPTGHYALDGNLDLTSFGNFTPIGYTSVNNNALPTAFSGVFDGLGHTVTGLTISNLTASNLGLFSKIGDGGIVRNLGLLGGSVTGGGHGSYGMLAGAVAAFMSGFGSGGTVVNDYATGTVDGGSGSNSVGGLIGSTSSFSVVSASYATGSVSGGRRVGGLIGNVGATTITASYATGPVLGGDSADSIGGLVGVNNGSLSFSYATGTVSAGTGATSVGGLVGQSVSLIASSYATGAVSVGAGSNGIGGLVGLNVVNSISASYSTGAVSAGVGSTSVGGLVGKNNNAITASYWDTTTSGQSAGVGTDNGVSQVTGLATSDWLTQGPVATSDGDWDFTTNWVPGYPYPVLRAVPYIVINGSVSTSAPSTFTIASILDQNGADATGKVNTSGLTAVSTGVAGDPAGGSGATAPGYQITYTGSTVSGPPTLTITATAETSTYGTAPTLNPADFSVSGLLNGDTIGSLTLALGSTAVTSTTAAAAYTGDIVPSGAVFSSGSATSYNIVYVNGTLTVQAKPVTVTATAQNSVYGSTPSLGSAGFTSTALVGADAISSVSLANTTGLTASSNATTTGVITPSAAVFAAGTTASNYAITYVAGVLTVTAKPVTVTATAQNTTYGSTPSLGTTGFTSTALIGADSISAVSLANTTGLTASSNATTTGVITPSAAVFAAGTLASNYAVTYATGTLTVTAKPITVTASAQNTTYGSTPSLGSAAFTDPGLVNGDTISAVSLANTTGLTATSNATTTGIITPSAALFGTGGASNYTISYATGVLTVTAKPITVTASAQNSVYGSTPSLGSTAFTDPGLANGDTISSVSLANTTGLTATSNATTTGIITPSAAVFAAGTLASNYALTYATGTLTVTAKPITVTASAQSSVYSSTPSLGSAAFTDPGLVNGDTIGSVTLTTAVTEASGVNTYSGAIVPSAASFSAGSAGNYSITYANGGLTVGQAALTITASAQNSVYGSTPALGGSLFTTSGLANSDAVSTVALSTGVTGSSNAGAYTGGITAGSAVFSIGSAANYAITYVAGNLTVTPKTAGVTATAQNSVVGTTPVLNQAAFTTSGLVNGDKIGSVTLTTTTVTNASAPKAYSNAIKGSLAVFSSGLASNYNIVYIGGTLTVTAAPPTVTASSIQVSSAGDNATTFTVTGLVVSGTGVGTGTGNVNMSSDSITAPTSKDNGS